MKYDAFSKYHPLVNFLFFLGAIGFGVVIQHPAYLAAGCLGGGIYYLLLKGRKGLGLVAGLLPLFLFLSAINPLFNTYGETLLFTVFGRPYTLEALYHGMAVSAIFLVMILWFGCCSVVLSSDKFTSLFGGLIPSLSLLLVMVLRLIPNLSRKAAQISGARRCIGKGVEGGSTKEKLLGGMTVLSTLTDQALEGGVVTGDSMHARGYGAAKRSSFQIYRMTGRDVAVLSLMIVLSAATLFGGSTFAQYTPQVQIARPGWGFAAYCVFVLIPSVLHVVDRLQWRASLKKL